MRASLRTFIVLLLGLWASPALADDVRFGRHVVPLFSRLGCNAGVCHGAVKGQGGFKLSLFGADPALDQARIVRDDFGRRLDGGDPDNSLFLLKATGRVLHQGGVRLRADSPEYAILRRWIAEGARLDPIEPVRLSIMPDRRTLRPGETFALAIHATFGDGRREDVTGLCTFESRDSTVAEVDASGRVTAVGVGDAALVVRYRSDPVLAMVLVPGAEAVAFPNVPEFNFIDRHVLAKLKLLQIPPADLCDDGTFLRRASLDIAGELPKPEEIRAFLASTDPERRAKKIDELLARPGHAAIWATRFCDLLKPGNYLANSGMQELAASRRFYEWLRAALTKNVAYDELVERILLATSREGRTEAEWASEVRGLMEEEAQPGGELKAYGQRRTLDLYWQRTGASGVKGTLQFAHAFLGLRMDCAQCHRHPHDVWQQSDLLDFANFFQRVGGGSSAGVVKQADQLTDEIKKLKDEAKKVGDQAKAAGVSKDDMKKFQDEAKTLGDRAKMLEDTSKRLKLTEVHTGGKPSFAEVVSPLGRQVSKETRLLGEKQAITLTDATDPRQPVMAWLRRPDNPFFAKAIVNRVWAYYFGRGIIDPPDHLSPLNPPSHPELLAELEKGFIASRYDLRWLHRTILTSRTYQQSARTNAQSKNDTRNYASFYPRRLPAEVLVDALNHATGGSETYPAELRMPAGAKAIEVAGGIEGVKERASLAYAFRIFGRPTRALEAQCDCDRDGTATIVQTLYLANHPRVLEKISNPQGRIAAILKDAADDGRRIEGVFLWTLSRLPTDEEKRASLALVQASSSPEVGLRELLWSLLNTKEFLLNY